MTTKTDSVYIQCYYDAFTKFISSINFSFESESDSKKYQNQFNNKYNTYKAKFDEYFQQYFNYGFIGPNKTNCYIQNLFALLRFLYKLNSKSLPVRQIEYNKSTITDISKNNTLFNINKLYENDVIMQYINILLINEKQIILDEIITFVKKLCNNSKQYDEEIFNKLLDNLNKLSTTLSKNELIQTIIDYLSDIKQSLIILIKNNTITIVKNHLKELNEILPNDQALIELIDNINTRLDEMKNDYNIVGTNDMLYKIKSNLLKIDKYLKQMDENYILKYDSLTKKLITQNMINTMISNMQNFKDVSEINEVVQKNKNDLLQLEDILNSTYMSDSKSIESILKMVITFHNSFSDDLINNINHQIEILQSKTIKDEIMIQDKTIYIKTEEDYMIYKIYDKITKIISYDINNFIINYYQMHEFLKEIQLNALNYEESCFIDINDDIFLAAFNLLINIIFDTSKLNSDLPTCFTTTNYDIELPILNTESQLIITQLRQSSLDYIIKYKGIPIEKYKGDDITENDIYDLSSAYRIDIRVYKKKKQHIYEMDDNEIKNVLNTIYNSNTAAITYDTIRNLSSCNKLEKLKDFTCDYLPKRIGHIAYACYIKSTENVDYYEHYIFDDSNTSWLLSRSTSDDIYYIRNSNCKYFNHIITKRISSPIYIDLSDIKNKSDYEKYQIHFKDLTDNNKELLKISNEYLSNKFDLNSGIYPYVMHFKGGKNINEFNGFNLSFTLMTLIIIVIIIAIIVLIIIKTKRTKMNKMNV